MDEHGEVGGYPNEFAGNGQMVLLVADSLNPGVTHVIKRVKGFEIVGSEVVFESYIADDWLKDRFELSRLRGACAP